MGKQFSAPKRKKVHHERPNEDDYDVAVKFAKACEKDLKEFLAAAVLFGSCATDKATNLSDIDVLMVVDDVSFHVTADMTEAYRLVVHGHAAKTSPRLHVNTLKLSNFWEYCREADPVVVNMLRDGHVILDRGFFRPAQLLLQHGRIRPSREAVWTYYARSPNNLRSARKHLLYACVDLYWAAMDAAHAALMSVGTIPPTPEHVPDLLEQKLVEERKLLAKRFPHHMRELYHLQKSILHRELRELSGEQYEGYWRETLQLVDALRTIVERHPPAP